MPRVLTYAAAVCAACAAWLLRGALALQSATPGAPRVGIVPPWWELALFILAGVCLVYLFRPSLDRVTPLFATVLCLAPWVPGLDAPALLIWTGPLATAWWVAAVLATLVSRGRSWRWPAGANLSSILTSPRLAPAIAAAVSAIVFAGVAWGVRGMAPLGDEPHYLVITQSLLSDGDLRIENNHARGEYRQYFAGEIKPDYWRPGRDGQIYSLHLPGVSALVAPAFLVGGYPAVVLFLILCSALGAALAWKLGFDLTRNAAAAWFGCAATVVALPVAFHSFAVFPEGPAGVLVLTGIWALFRAAGIGADPRPGSRTAWLLHGLALALLPWLHARFALVAGVLALAILLRLPRTREGLRRAIAFLAIPVAAALGWFGYFVALYGTPNPLAPWPELVSSLAFVPDGVLGVLFDQQFGLLLFAPVTIVTVAGWCVLLRRQPRLALELAAIVVPYVLLTTWTRIWWGGWNAPGRFMVSIIWIGAVPAAAAWAGARTRASRGAALGALLISLWTTLALAFVHDGRLAYNQRDGYSQWLEYLSPLTELTLGYPSFFRLADRTAMLALQCAVVVLLFGSAFLVLRWADRRVRGTGALALGTLLLFAAAGMATAAVLWQMNGSAGYRVASAQLNLLSAAQESRRLGVEYEGWPSLRQVDEAIGRLRIESPPRLLGASPGASLVLPGWFPAGAYRIVAEGSTPEATLELLVQRTEVPIQRVSIPPGSDRFELSLDLPADVPAVIVRGTGLRQIWLRPVHVATRRERFSELRAETARRYGGTMVWCLDRHNFREPAGLWTRGGGVPTRLVLQPQSGSVQRLLVRNGPVGNDVVLVGGQGAWRESLSLAPGEERDVRVPLDPERKAALLEVTSRGGFRPSDVEPGSADRRYLGVWLEPR